MAATAIDTMLQSNSFHAKKKEDVDNKDNLWYVRGSCDVSRVSECFVSRPFVSDRFYSAVRVMPSSFTWAFFVRKISRPTALTVSHSMLLYVSQVVYSGGSAEQRQQQATVEQKRSCSR